jgi:uncharacterized membrane protein YhhN
MKIALYPLVPLAVTVFCLIRAEFADDRRKIYFYKPVSTALVILTALLSTWGGGVVNGTYTTGVLWGLALCMAGDVMLMFPQNRKAFLAGLIFFLLGHVAYAVTFAVLGGFHGGDFVSGLVLFVLGAGLFLYMRPHLGKMQVPVILYILVISFMVNRAEALFGTGAVTDLQAWMIMAGAVLFYISDVILAYARYVNPFRTNRISLAFYYAGQFLIALAASYFV